MEDKREEFGFPRTICACRICVDNCKNMPGMLIPSDLDRMLRLCPGIMPLAWAERTLLASPGALVMRDAELFRIPTLVPAVKANGECIHLIGRTCEIHAVAPFGCSFFDCGPERGTLARDGLMAIMRAWHESDSLYRIIWMHLYALNLVQERPEVLRQKMVRP